MVIRFREASIAIFLARYPSHHLPENLVSEGVDWALVAEYLHRNKIAPFALHFVNCPQCRRLVSDGILHHLSAEMRLCAIKESLQEKEKNNLLKFFSSKKIKAISFKDYKLWGLIQPGGVLQKSDIDFFVFDILPQQMDEILKIKNFFLFPVLGPDKDDFSLWERDYRKKTRGVYLNLNLHFRFVTPTSRGKVESLNEKTAKQITDYFRTSLHKQGSIFIPSAEMELLILILHFVLRDTGVGLRALYEIAQFMKKYSTVISWENFVAVAQSFDTLSYCLFVLGIASSLFDVVLPLSVSRRLNASMSVGLAMFFYSPFITALVDGIPEWINSQEKENLKAYRFFLRTILWEKLWLFKLGPRLFFQLIFYVLPTWLIFKAAERKYRLKMRDN